MKRLVFAVTVFVTLFSAGIAGAQCNSAASASSCSTSARHGLFYKLTHRHQGTVASACATQTISTVVQTTTVTTQVQKKPVGGKRFSGVFLDAAKAELKRIVVSTGRLTEAGYDQALANYTTKDAVNWSGFLTFLNGLLADAPEIIALVQQIIALFGGG